MPQVVFCADWDEAAALGTDPAVHIPAWQEAFIASFLEHGLVLTDDVWQHIIAEVVGMAEPLEVRAFVKRAKEMGASNLTIERIYQLRHERLGYWQGPKREFRLTPGFREVLEGVSALNGKSCVVSNAGHYIVDRMVNWMGLDTHLPAHLRVCSDHEEVLRTEQFKPNLLPWELALSLAEATSQDVTFFLEDSFRNALALVKNERLFARGFLLMKRPEEVPGCQALLRDQGIEEDHLMVMSDQAPLHQFLKPL